MEEKKKESSNGLNDIIDFLKNELTRASNRKNILENKGYILGSLLCFLTFSSKGKSSLFTIPKGCVSLYDLICVLASLVFLISMYFIFLVIIPNREYFFSEKLDINEVIFKEKKEICAFIMYNYQDILEKLHENCNKKAFNLKNAIISSTIFFILYIIILVQ